MIRISTVAILLTGAVLAAAGPALAAGDLELRVGENTSVSQPASALTGGASPIVPVNQTVIQPGWYRSMEDKGLR